MRSVQLHSTLFNILSINTLSSKTIVLTIIATIRMKYFIWRVNKKMTQNLVGATLYIIYREAVKKHKQNDATYMYKNDNHAFDRVEKGFTSSNHPQI